jgi:hypothetical protein
VSGFEFQLGHVTTRRWLGTLAGPQPGHVAGDAGVLLGVVGELSPGGEVGILKMRANMVKSVLSMQTVVSSANGSMN